jgi:hypothetical protein
MAGDPCRPPARLADGPETRRPVPEHASISPDACRPFA